jgi:transposase
MKKRRVDRNTARRLTARQRRALDAIERDGRAGRERARRARIVILHFKGWTASAIARLCRVSRPTVYLWVRRFCELGAEGLRPKRRTGRPRSIAQGRISRLLALSAARRRAGAGPTIRELARRTGISKSSVQRYVAAARVVAGRRQDLSPS